MPDDPIIDITGDGDYVQAIPLGWQDETLTTREGWRRNLFRAVIAAVDAWRGRRRDWRAGVDW